jgi:hypothetical protein
MKCIQDFHEEISRKETTWKTQKMGGLFYNIVLYNINTHHLEKYYII